MFSQGGLATARRPEHHDQLAGMELEVDAIEGADPPPHRSDRPWSVPRRGGRHGLCRRAPACLPVSLAGRLPDRGRAKRKHRDDIAVSRTDGRPPSVLARSGFLHPGPRVVSETWMPAAHRAIHSVPGRDATACRRPERCAERRRSSSERRGSATEDRLAERVGFEPTDALASAVFKTAAFDRSATSPGRKGRESGPLRALRPPRGRVRERVRSAGSSPGSGGGLRRTERGRGPTDATANGRRPAARLGARPGDECARDPDVAGRGRPAAALDDLLAGDPRLHAGLGPLRRRLRVGRHAHGAAFSGRRSSSPRSASATRAGSPTPTSTCTTTCDACASARRAASRSCSRWPSSRR